MSRNVDLSKQITEKIFSFRGHHVMLDRDLAALYCVLPKRLNEQVKRNRRRFPKDFMFQLNTVEKNELVANCDRLSLLKYSTSNPYAFTEQGVAMLSSVLNSERAILVNIQIMRAFVSMKRTGVNFEVLRRRIDSMERKYDGQFRIIFDAIRKLLEPPARHKQNKIGFHSCP